MRGSRVTICLGDLLKVLWLRGWIVLGSAAVCTCAAFFFLKFCVQPVYEADTLLIVNTQNDPAAAVSSDQIASAVKMAGVYSIIMKSDPVLQTVIDRLQLTESCEDLYDRVTVSTVHSTQILRVTARDTNPDTAMQICDQIAAAAPQVIENTVGIGKIKVLKSAARPTYPVSPDITKECIRAGLFGMIVSMAGIFGKVLNKKKIEDLKDVETYLELQTIGVIPYVQ